MFAFAWLLNDLFFEDAVWAGFLIEAVLFFLIAAVAGFVAYRAAAGGLAAGAGDGDRGGQADPPDARVGHHAGAAKEPTP